VTRRFVEHHPVYGVVRGARLLGVYALSGVGPPRELEHFWVAPEQIGRGVGARMLEHSVATLRADGARVLRIASDPYAEGFYLRMRAASRSVAVHAEQEDAAADGAGRWAPETQAYLI